MKTALLLVATIVSHGVFSPPTPPARSSSLSSSLTRFGKGDVIGGLVKWIRPIVGHAAVWSSSLSELLVNLANDRPMTLIPESIWTTLTSSDPSATRSLRILPTFFTYNHAIVDDHNLVTTDLYAVVRQASYTAWMIYTVGLLLMQLSPRSWIAECGLLESMIGRIVALLSGAYNLYIIMMLEQEDKVLKRQSGKQ
ncbi:hypothetical protein OH77DRAFT_1525548 [Trametes cingulata]|nr:hypothetical protein OH77DRAFT_1525548 [Trametes cingulata]